jgi:hypothetical protein
VLALKAFSVRPLSFKVSWRDSYGRTRSWRPPNYGEVPIMAQNVNPRTSGAGAETGAGANKDSRESSAPSSNSQVSSWLVISLSQHGFIVANSIFLSTQVSKRLQQELMSLMMSGDKGISAFPDGDKLLNWVATVEGPHDSVYEGAAL